MRIISGIAKGKRLYVPRGGDIRPTADRIKESVFDILGQRLQGRRVLDLFSGTGNLGLEALSRGAEQATFVEASKPAIEALTRNITNCGFDPCASVLAMSVSRALPLLAGQGQSFELIFADPPYGRGWVDKTIRGILTHKILSREGMAVIEHDLHEQSGAGPTGLSLLRQEKYGQTWVSFLEFA
jgi:16S rRNA (guanine(966)-N(2))-methyltransferase RsmD